MKNTKSKARKLYELISLAMKVQTETKYCVFIRMAGHIDQLGIDIRESKKNYNTEIIESQFYFGGSCYDGDEWFEKKYKKVKAVLISILETGEVDFNHEYIETEEVVSVDYKHTF